MTQANVYINFHGNCREAMSFYKECLNGELNLQTIEGSPIENQCPASMKNQIMHSTLTKGGIVIMATDMTGPDGFQQGNNISVMLNCSSEDEINNYFSKLSEGGKVIDPLGVKFWGGMFGVITDKFGICWMFHYDKNQNM